MCQFALLYDDREDRRRQLKLMLESHDLSVLTPDSVAGTLRALQEQPALFQFILVDHQFSPAEESVLDAVTGTPVSSGLDLVHELSKINPTVPIILYSTEAGARSAPSEAEAKARGAYRLVLEEEITALIQGLRSQMDELGTIARRLEEIQNERRSLQSVIGNLGVGYQLVDWHGKAWFRDAVFQDIVGRSGRPDAICYCLSHGYPLAHGMCGNCLVRRAIEEGKEQNSLFFSPTYPGGEGTAPRFDYLNVYVSPVFAQPRQASDGVGTVGQRPSQPQAVTNREREHRGAFPAIAAMEAVTRVSGTDAVRSLGLRKHLDILARSLQDMGIARVRVYEIVGGRRRVVRGLVHAGSLGKRESFDGYEMELTRTIPSLGPRETALAKLIRGDDHVEFSLTRKRDLGIREGHHPVCVALFAGRQPIGIAALDNGLFPVSDTKSLPPLEPESIAVQPTKTDGCIEPSPMAVLEEMARVIATKPHDAAPATESERAMERIRRRLLIESGDAKDIIDRVLHLAEEEIVGCTMGHVRSLEGTRLRLVGGFGQYRETTEKEYGLGDARMGARVAATGIAEFRGKASERDSSPPGLNGYTEAEKAVLQTIESDAICPLLEQGQVVGVAVFHSTEENYFTGARRHLFQALTDLLAHALHDHRALSQIDARLALAEASAVAAAALVHGLYQPVGAIQMWLSAAKEDVEALPASRDHLEKALQAMETECGRLARMRASLRELILPDGSQQEVDLRQTVESVVKDVLGSDEGIEVTRDLSGPMSMYVNYSLLCTCLAVLLRNAQDALREHSGGRRVLVVLRNVGPDEIREIRSLPRNAVAIDVIDSGPGPRPEHEKRLFEYGHSTKPGGMGVGLALARRLALSAGGDMYFGKRDPRGTRFTLLLAPGSVPGTVTHTKGDSTR